MVKTADELNEVARVETIRRTLFCSSGTDTAGCIVWTFKTHGLEGSIEGSDQPEYVWRGIPLTWVVAKVDNFLLWWYHCDRGITGNLAPPAVSLAVDDECCHPICGRFIMSDCLMGPLLFMPVMLCIVAEVD